MLSEQIALENSSQISSNHNLSNKHSNNIFNLQRHSYHRISSSFDEITLINNNLQVFISVILCFGGLFGAILHITILIRRCFRMKSFLHQINIQLLFDFCHLINILFTHIIIVIVYIKKSTNIDFYCPISTFFFSLSSFGSISFLCLGAFKQSMYLFKKSSHYRCIHHRLLAHRIILVTSLTWLIIHFPKLDFHEKF